MWPLSEYVCHTLAALKFRATLQTGVVISLGNDKLKYV